MEDGWVGLVFFFIFLSIETQISCMSLIIKDIHSK